MMDENFYTALPIHPFTATTLFDNASDFTDIPEDWFVLCTDVESSTKFYQDGRWHIVNKLAAAGIDVVLRTTIKHNIEVPYVYGGDGILACFPQSMLKELSTDLVHLYRYGHAVCGANLRVGIVPVKDIRRAGYNFRIKRVGNTGTVSHTLFDDSAFNWIDNVIKNDTEYTLTSMMSDVDVSRLRYDEYVLPIWQKVKTAYEGEEYLCLIIMTTNQVADRLSFYNELLNEFYKHAPRFFDGHPIISLEKDDVFSLDFIKTDGSLKIIISAKKSSADAILQYLQKLEHEGTILYGHTRSTSSVITYVIKESENYMAGLLDVEDGGYVAAAQELKAKMKD